MIVSELKIFNFRRFKSENGAPGLQITFHKGLNALIGENDSGKTAVIDALKLVLLTQSNEYIRPSEEDFYISDNGDACSEFKIDCTISDFTQNEAKNFIEYLSFSKTEDNVEYTLELHYRAWKEGHKIYQELHVGDIEDGISIDGKARELLKAVYLKPLRDAEREMSSGRGSRISQILLNHPVFKDKKEHAILDILKNANDSIERYFTSDTDGKRILQAIRNNLELFNDKDQASNAELKTSDIQLKAILESLSLNAPEINPGLGELNLLFIAAELLLLEDDTDGGLKLALIEELEAHLHPQAQLRLISYLQNEYTENDVQIILNSIAYDIAESKGDTEIEQMTDISALRREVYLARKELQEYRELVEAADADFEDKLEELKQQEIASFFSALNNEKYGFLIDSLYLQKRACMDLKKSGEKLPYSLEGVPAFMDRLLSFLRDAGISPASRFAPHSTQKLTLEQMQGCRFEPLPERKAPIKEGEAVIVNVLSSGWKLGNTVISYPVLQEDYKNNR